MIDIFDLALWPTFQASTIKFVWGLYFLSWGILWVTVYENRQKCLIKSNVNKQLTLLKCKQTAVWISKHSSLRSQFYEMRLFWAVFKHCELLLLRNSRRNTKVKIIMSFPNRPNLYQSSFYFPIEEVIDIGFSRRVLQKCPGQQSDSSLKNLAGVQDHWTKVKSRQVFWVGM